MCMLFTLFAALCDGYHKLLIPMLICNLYHHCAKLPCSELELYFFDKQHRHFIYKSWLSVRQVEINGSSWPGRNADRYCEPVKVVREFSSLSFCFKRAGCTAGCWVPAWPFCLFLPGVQGLAESCFTFFFPSTPCMYCFLHWRNTGNRGKEELKNEIKMKGPVSEAHRRPKESYAGSWFLVRMTEAGGSPDLK